MKDVLVSCILTYEGELWFWFWMPCLMETNSATDARLAQSVPLGPPEGREARRLRKTVELATTDLYQRRKRNLLLFYSAVIVVALSQPKDEIPIPFLGGNVTLPVTFAFAICVLTVGYFLWEFYTDWETARRRNAEVISELDRDGQRDVAAELHQLVSVQSYKLRLAVYQIRSLIRSIEDPALRSTWQRRFSDAYEQARKERLETEGSGSGLVWRGARSRKASSEYSRILSEKQLAMVDSVGSNIERDLGRTGAALGQLARELPKWRQSSDQLRKSYVQLHESVSKLQQTNFYIDWAIANLMSAVAVALSGYIVITAFIS